MVYHSTVCSEVLSPHWLEHHQGEVGDHNAGEGDVEGGGGAVDDVDYPVLFDVKRVADGPVIIGSGKLHDLCRIWVLSVLPQERKLCSVAHSHEIIRVDGPGHHTGKPLVKGVVRLDCNGLLVVKTDPAVTTETRGVK